MKDIYIHHSGGLGNNKYASTRYLSVEQIAKYHKSSPYLTKNFPSKYIDSSLKWLGYNAVYDPKNRTFYQGRAIGEATAAQKGYNDQFSLCVIGNYSKTRVGSPVGSVDKLSKENREDLSEYFFDLINGNRRNLVVVPGIKLDFSISRLFPHRKVSNTECYGSFLSDTVFEADLINLYSKKIWLFKKLIELYIIAQNLIQKREASDFGSSDRECGGLIM